MSDPLRDALVDFALWNGDSHEAAVWAAETYLNELAILTPPAETPRGAEDGGEK